MNASTTENQRYRWGWHNPSLRTKFFGILLLASVLPTFIIRYVQVNSITILLLCCLVALIGLLGSQNLFGPLERLTKTAESIANGNINSEAEVENCDEIGRLAISFNRMTHQFRDSIAKLEEREAARTKDLATAAEVGTATATILDTDTLLQEVVNLAKERFNLYHSQIYLIDESYENLVLSSATGEAGRQIKAQGRSIPLDDPQSLIARAARERKGVISNDVNLPPEFPSESLLPDKRSELAVPMIIGRKVIGVFDLQSNITGRFTESDINIQTTLASQVSTSLQNVRSFVRAQQQAEHESKLNIISQKIQGATTVEAVLQIAARELGQALGAPITIAQLRLKEKLKTETIAGSSSHGPR